ncbi:hypothetical protein BD408DRAFT_427252 [Parasitella parasitica]|nr:hypothetical protein BD408DRAFT_427265 [Parasitella parasitica]KAI8635737.1 hypothetical protein BD408DRAFT_427252 [Parasitella parasitica]
MVFFQGFYSICYSHVLQIVSIHLKHIYLLFFLAPVMVFFFLLVPVSSLLASHLWIVYFWLSSIIGFLFFSRPPYLLSSRNLAGGNDVYALLHLHYINSYKYYAC